MTLALSASPPGDGFHHLADPSASGAFDPVEWLDALTRIGGGYALTSGRQLTFIADQCDSDELAGVMTHLMGRPDRQEQVKRVIEQRRNGEA